MRNVQLEQDFLFAEAIRNSSKGNYLGDLGVARTLLFTTVDECKEILTGGHDEDEMEVRFTALASKLAHIFLGEDKTYNPIPGWNRPGGIDVNMKSTYGIEDETPFDVMRSAFLMFCHRLLSIFEKVIEGMPDEDWKLSIETEVYEFADYCVGLTPEAITLAENLK